MLVSESVHGTVALRRLKPFSIEEGMTGDVKDGATGHIFE